MSEKNIIDGNSYQEMDKPILDEELIHQEMVRLGFWSESDSKEMTLQDVMSKQNALVTEMRELLTNELKTKDSSSVETLVLLRQKCKDNHFLLNAGLKQQRQEQDLKKKTAWNDRHQQEILYLGEGVSSQLNHQQSDRSKLENLHLPFLNNAKDLAKAMGIGIPELRFLSYAKKTSTLRHYQQYDVRKKSGGVRRISAPMPRLKRAHYWILENILDKAELHKAAHGFVKGRSIKSNAELHVGSKLVINIDLKDFFPSITYPRINGLFKALGYSRQIASILALLCTEFDHEEVILDGRRYYVGRGLRKLPQGAPTSPALSNIICRRLDARLTGMAKKLGYEYSRYADDLSFSSQSTPVGNSQKLLWRCKSIIKDEGFTIHPDKTQIMRSHCRQEVTGIIVNDKLGLQKSTLKKFRALLYQIGKDGLEGKQWNGITGPALMNTIKGFANYILMIDRDKGHQYLQQIKKLEEKVSTDPVKVGGNQLNVPLELNRIKFREKAALGQSPRQDWWEASRKEPVIKAVNTSRKLPEPLYRKAIQLSLQSDSAWQKKQGLRKGKHRNKLLKNKAGLDQPYAISVPDKVVSKQYEALDKSLKKRNPVVFFVSGLVVLASILYLLAKFI